jgi:hypothetical protein
MKEVLFNRVFVQSSSSSGGVPGVASQLPQFVLSPSRIQGVAERHFERGTNYD